MNNQDIRAEVKAANLKLWQIANKLGITDGNFSRKLRQELSDSEKEQIREIIVELKSPSDAPAGSPNNESMVVIPCHA